MGRFRGVELADLTLSSDRLELRRWRPEDADRVHEVMQDDVTRESLGLPSPYSLEDAQAWVTDIGLRGRNAGHGIAAAVIDRAAGRVVGACDIRGLTGDPEIGFWTAPDSRGHGYAAEAARVLTEWALEHDADRVRLLCDVRNIASARSAMNAGFRFEGVARHGALHGGRRADLAVFARITGDDGAAIAPAFPSLPGGQLGDGVLAVRAMHPDDAAALHATEDELAVGWGFDGAPPTREDTERTAVHAGLNWLVGGTAQCAMVDVATGAFAGELQLRKAGPPGIVGLGYTVHPAFRGRGYTTRALRLIVPWAFDVAGVARLELGAKRDNVASQRAAAAAGFTQESVHAGRLRNPDGTFSDEIGFALINPG